MGQPPHLDGVRHRWVRARGLEFHVAEAGSGEDVVLCLHGWPQHWYEWRQLLPALADRHRVLALDLRGFGLSAAPRAGYEKENMADDAHAWRFTYQAMVVAPLLGYQLHRRGTFVRRVLVAGSTVRQPWDEETLDVFASNLAEPARARAAARSTAVSSCARWCRACADATRAPG